MSIPSLRSLGYKEGRLLSPFCYVGGKRGHVRLFGRVLTLNRFRPRLLVEPFCGGASVTLHFLRERRVERAIIGDIDPNLVAFWRIVFGDKVALQRLVEDFQVIVQDAYDGQTQRAIEYVARLHAHQLEAPHERALGFWLASVFTYRGRASGQASERIIRHAVHKCGAVKNYVRRALNAHYYAPRIAGIVKGDYKRTLEVATTLAEHEDIGTDEILYYLDPPYYEQEHYYSANSMTPEAHEGLCETLQALKSPYLLSYNDHPRVRELYAGANIIAYRYYYGLQVQGGSNHEEIPQLLISNKLRLEEAVAPPLRLWDDEKPHEGTVFAEGISERREGGEKQRDRGDFGGKT